ncbi:histidine kinase [Halorubrum sp. Atlit-8R]|uniref:ATP-binding protein n=1 Tax=unclassified Halorubrum TaxID=2642239 RepID=UPI000EF20604|nr:MULTISPECIES: ATP-binding protein [unclassified Halorubrum]RLM67523.1 histidine kinase [Halorubrum sp. Atlit-9R]RLM77682.1 histidine kinase [Halorubrum sp. Atlit-8R]
MSTLRGHHAVSLIGAGLLAAAAVHHVTEIGAIGTSAGPLLAFALDGGIAVTVLVASRRIARRELSPAEEWRVARWTATGTVFAVAAFAATLAVRAFEGRPLVEPVFPMLVAAGVGSLGGAVAGYYAVRQAAEARRARDAVRAVSFVNHLLRHDLRNDLSTIRGYADLLDGDGEGADHAATVASKAAEGLDRIEATSAVADAILGDADSSRVDLAETTRGVLASVADDESVTVESDLPETAPVAANDGVRSVVHNLVENAIEHAGPAVTVRVSVRVDADAGEVALVVEDDGSGLPPEIRDGSFFADEPSAADPNGGVSGLRLVATLAEAYGGSLTPGESALGGARFAVRLPHAPADSTGSDT